METDLETLAITVAAVMHGRTLATAESLTGGQLSSLITAIPGASEYFQGGVVAYSNEVKHEILGIAQTDIEEFGVISAQTASAMAFNVSKVFGTEFGLAVTGVAGPTQQEGQAVGTVFVACHRIASTLGPAETQVEELHFNPTGVTSIERRAQIREETVAAALELLVSML